MKLKNELPLMIIVLLPFFYLAYLWDKLPDKVPMHWNLNGEIDRFGEKSELILIPILLPLFTYILFLIIPKIDPKNQIKKMGNKFEQLKFLLTFFMSILALYILYSSKIQSFSNPNYIPLIIGLLYVFLGNYFKTIKTNYFIGIRTPWTLENETVWKETHKLGGILWFIGGIIVIVASLFLDVKLNFIFFIVITTTICIVPIAFSYFKFREVVK